MRVINITIFEVKRIFRDKGMFIGSIMMAIFFMFYMGIAFNTENNKINVSIANNDQGEYAEYLIEFLESNSILNIKLKSSNTVKEDIKNSISSIGYIIPQDFSEKIKSGTKVDINVVKLAENQDESVVSSLMDSYISKIKVAYTIAGVVSNNINSMEAFNKNFKIELSKLVEDTTIKEKSEAYIKTNPKAGKNKINVGYTIVFVMMIATYAMAAILKEKKEGTLSRLLSTPARRVEIIMGHFGGVLVQGYIQLGILVIATSLLFKTFWGNSYLLLFAVLSAFLFAVIGMGLMFSSLVKTYTQLDALIPSVIMPTSMLAGAFWPIEYMPEFMQKAAYIAPQYWAISGVSALSNSSSINNVLIPILVLLGFAIIFISIGVAKLKNSV